MGGGMQPQRLVAWAAAPAGHGAHGFGPWGLGGGRSWCARGLLGGRPGASSSRPRRRVLASEPSSTRWVSAHPFSNRLWEPLQRSVAALAEPAPLSHQSMTLLDPRQMGARPHMDCAIALAWLAAALRTTSARSAGMPALIFSRADHAVVRKRVLSSGSGLAFRFDYPIIGLSIPLSCPHPFM